MLQKLDDLTSGDECRDFQFDQHTILLFVLVVCVYLEIIQSS